MNMRLFISYSHQDKWMVKELVELLREAGHEPWFDHELIVGDNWKDQIAKAIEDSHAFLYMLTQDSLKSEYCRWEFALAANQKKPVIPVLLRQLTEEIPEGLKDIQYVDLSNGIEVRGFVRIFRALNNQIIKVGVASPPEPKRSRIESPQAVNAASSNDLLIISMRKMVKDAVEKKKLEIETSVSWDFGDFERDEEVGSSLFGTRGFARFYQHGVMVWHDTGKYEHTVYGVWGGIGWRYKLMGKARWMLLGLPLTDEAEAAPSPYGTTGRYNLFENGVMVWHRDRSYHDQFFAVLGPISKKYNALGGSGSHLGFPISEVYATAEGQRCDFEGGAIVTLKSNKDVHVVRQLMTLDYADSPFNHGWREYTGNDDLDCVSVCLEPKIGFSKPYIAFNRSWGNRAIKYPKDGFEEYELVGKYCGVTVKSLCPDSWFRFYIQIRTNSNVRHQYLEFDTGNRTKQYGWDENHQSEYWKVPLPAYSEDGRWHTFVFDLAELVQEGFTNHYQSLISLRFRGSVGIAEAVISDSVDAIRHVCIDSVFVE